jgi:sialate O-acetylesterase
MELPNNADFWVLAGQSNMQGCGWVAGSLPPDPRVWSFSTAGHWGPAEEPLHRLWESFTPVHQDFMRPWLLEADKELSDADLARREDETRVIGAGLGIAFGRAMADATGRPIGLIPAAHGGTSLDQWSPKLKSKGGRSLYGAMLERLDRSGVLASGRLRGILWYQGESDATTIDLGRSYAERFDAWIAAARADAGIPDLPVIVVQIGRVIEPSDRAGLWPGWDLVREALAELPKRVAGTAATSSIDLPLVDPIHVDTPGLIRLGGRLARQALRLTQQPELEPGPRVESIAWTKAPVGPRSAIRARFGGLAGGWTARDNIRGFEVRVPEPAYRAPLFVVNAWVDGAEGGGTDVIVLLNRPAEEDARLGYGLGVNPACDLVDQADMPLCAFLPRQID